MSPLYQRLAALLQRYLSQSTAEAVLRRALRDASIAAHQLDLVNLPAVITELERGVRLFVSPERQPPLRAELAMLGARATALPTRQQLKVVTEDHISDARMAARGICSEAGARSLVSQKVTTIVSELARNIVGYTSGGSIELSVVDGPPRKVRVRAVDTGKGIKDLAAVLSGTYKSRTGLGKGVLGVKRLSDEFDIKTGPDGTIIDVSVCL